MNICVGFFKVAELDASELSSILMRGGLGCQIVIMFKAVVSFALRVRCIIMFQNLRFGTHFHCLVVV